MRPGCGEVPLAENPADQDPRRCNPPSRRDQPPARPLPPRAHELCHRSAERLMPATPRPENVVAGSGSGHGGREMGVLSSAPRTPTASPDVRARAHLRTVLANSHFSAWPRRDSATPACGNRTVVAAAGEQLRAADSSTASSSAACTSSDRRCRSARESGDRSPDKSVRASGATSDTEMVVLNGWRRAAPALRTRRKHPMTVERAGTSPSSHARAFPPPAPSSHASWQRPRARPGPRRREPSASTMRPCTDVKIVRKAQLAPENRSTPPRCDGRRHRRRQEALDRVQDRAADMIVSALQFSASASPGVFRRDGFAAAASRAKSPERRPRPAAPCGRAAQAAGFASVARDALQPGDLVFFNTLRREFSHVGIYIGEHRFIHAPSRGKDVRTDDLRQTYWADRFNGARRAGLFSAVVPAGD